MKLVSDYMREDTMRHALNELTRKTFFFDFEDWVTGGYFEGDPARGPHRLHGRPVWKPDGVQLRRGPGIRDPAGGADQRRQRQCIGDFRRGSEGL